VKRRIERLSGKDFVWPYDAALFYAALGDKDRAFEWLEKNQKERDGWLLFLNADPRLSPLRSDPRFHDLVRRGGCLKFPAAQRKGFRDRLRVFLAPRTVGCSNLPSMRITPSNGGREKEKR
jgi:hypothetical protein